MPLRDSIGFQFTIDDTLIPQGSRRIWSQHGRAFYEELRSAFTDEQTFSRIDVDVVACLNGLPAHRKAAAKRMILRGLIEYGALVSVGTHMAFAGTRAAALIPRFVTGRSANTWVRHGRIIEREIAKLPANQRITRPEMLGRFDWGLAMTEGSRVALLSMMWREIMGRRLLVEVARQRKSRYYVRREAADTPK